MKIDFRAATLVAFFVLVIVSVLMYFSFREGDTTYRDISVGGTVVNAFVADSDDERSLGLSGHAPLKPREGMLFEFDEDGMYGFWMKDMLFSIDIVWLSIDGTIVSIVSHASPESYPTVFKPDRPARYVLELPAGTAATLGVKIGDRVGL